MSSVILVENGHVFRCGFSGLTSPADPVDHPFPVTLWLQASRGQGGGRLCLSSMKLLCSMYLRGQCLLSVTKSTEPQIPESIQEASIFGVGSEGVTAQALDGGPECVPLSILC